MDRLNKELRALNDRIYRLETQLKAINYSQHNESIAKIDYLAMMTDIDVEEEEEEELDDADI